MGCTPSKDVGGHKKRASWYSPLPRSVSAPIHTQPSENPPESSHYDNYGMMDDPALTGSFVRLLSKNKALVTAADHAVINKTQADHHHAAEEHYAPSGSIKKLKPGLIIHHHTLRDHLEYGSPQPTLQQATIPNMKLKISLHKNKQAFQDHAEAKQAFKNQAEANDAFSMPDLEHRLSFKRLNAVMDMPEHDDEGMDIINTWDSRDGHEDGIRTRFSLRPNGGHVKGIDAGKSLSFNTVNALDDCFTEMGSPIWPRCFLPEHVKKKEDALDSDASPRFDGVTDHLYTGSSGLKSPSKSQVLDCKLNLLCEGERSPTQKGLPEVKSPSNSHVSGHGPSLAFSGAFPGGSGLNSPLRSPSKSLLLSPLKGSGSPLFDPSILAAFEQALESITGPDDGWMLVNDASNEPSSLSSSDKFTWISSEASSDAESPQSEISFTGTADVDMSSKLLPHDGDDDEEQEEKCKQGSLSDLERFELRCPPRGEDKVVLYFTSLRGVRNTYQDCCALRLILQGLGVDVDERDVWMHLKFREELTELLGHRRLPVPRLFIKGRYIGGAEEVKQLHEDGILVRLIKDLPTFGMFRKVCDGCADVRFIPCLTCSGSCKLLDVLDRVIRCSECNENGLIMCPICRNDTFVAFQH